MELIIENIRSFVDRHTIPVKPLTLLTGENSSGKSTFLASFAVVNDPFSFPFRPRFNDPPYSMGNYDTIATYKGGSYGHAKSFSLGYKRNWRMDREPLEMVATYIDNKGLIEPSSIVAKKRQAEGEIVFSQQNDKPQIEMSYKGSSKSFGPISFPFEEFRGNIPGIELSNLFPFLLYKLDREDRFQSGDIDIQTFEDFASLFRNFVQQKAISIAPIRTKPRRTYDEISEDFSPEGEHIPFVLSRLLADPKSRASIDRFGDESGLYSKLDVKRLGKHNSDPTQVMVTSSGRPTNLIDVGYGVSQVLPVIVQSILATNQMMVLLQQPEVHLHPRAQAALGSLFVNLVANDKKQFIIETHSDYIIDRVRTEVGRGNIAAENVCILYFEKCGIESRVYPMSLSSSGDILNAPPSYREFFLKEEMSLLNRTER